MKKIMLLTIMALFAIPVSAGNKKVSIYRDELKRLKKSREHEMIFDEDASPALSSIHADIETYKELNIPQRLIRFLFFFFDPFVVTPSTMPQLHSYVNTLCKKNGIATPTIFVTRAKNGFYNAAAQKLLISTGAIIIGQQIINETTQEELEAIVAHEIGHIKHDHINKIILLKLVSYWGAKIVTDLAIESYRTATDTKYRCYTENQLTLKSQIPFLSACLLPSFIINKSFERQADAFAFENDRAEGLIEFFEDLKAREQQSDRDFDVTYTKIKNNESKIDFIDNAWLKTRFYLALGLHKLGKAIHYVLAETPLGDHPSHQARIDAAKEYLALHPSDWNVAQG